MSVTTHVVLPDGTTRTLSLDAGYFILDVLCATLPNGSSIEDFIVQYNNAALDTNSTLPSVSPGEELTLHIIPAKSIADAGAEVAPQADASTNAAESSAPAPAFPDMPPPQPVTQALCKYDYRPAAGPDGEGHLPFKKGELVEVVEKGDAGWWVARRPSTGEEGFVPSAYLQELPSHFNALPVFQNTSAQTTTTTTTTTTSPKGDQVATNVPPASTSSTPRGGSPPTATTATTTTTPPLATSITPGGDQISNTTAAPAATMTTPRGASPPTAAAPASSFVPGIRRGGSPPNVAVTAAAATAPSQAFGASAFLAATSSSNPLAGYTPPPPASTTFTPATPLRYGSHRFTPADAVAAKSATPTKANARGGMRIQASGPQTPEEEAEFEQFLNEMAEAPQRIKEREDAERLKDWEETQRYLREQKEAREKRNVPSPSPSPTPTPTASFVNPLSVNASPAPLQAAGSIPSLLAVPSPSRSVRGGSAISGMRSSTSTDGGADDEATPLRAAIRLDEVQVVLPSGESHTHCWSSGETLAQVKDALIRKGALGPGAVAHHFAFRAPGTVGITLDENVPLSSLAFLAACTRRAIMPTLLLANKQSEESRREKTVSREIGALLGRPVVVSHEQDEVAAFRQLASRLRHESKADQPAGMQRTGSSGLGKKLLVRVHLEQVVKLLPLEPANETASAFIRRLHGKHMRGAPKPPEAYALRIAAGDLVPGDLPIEELPYVAACVAKNIPPEFSLAPAPEDDDPLEDYLPPSTEFSHGEISLARHAPRPAAMQVLSVWDAQRPFRFKLMGADNVGLRAGGPDEAEYYVQATIHHGEEALSSTQISSPAQGVSASPRWNQWMNLDLLIANLPLSARLSLTLLARRRSAAAGAGEEPVGWANVQLFDWRHELRQGVLALSLWPDERANPIGTTQPAPSSLNPPVLFVAFDAFALPLVHPAPAAKGAARDEGLNKSAQAQEVVAWIEQLASKDPLFELDTKSRKALWVARKYCTLVPTSLPKLLSSVPYADRSAVAEMHALLARWPLLAPTEALQLLDAQFPDPVVRAYAVKCLEVLPDAKLIDYLLQLIQVLKYEPYHNSPLARFVLRRALISPRIGKAYFWYLKAELHVPEIAERCAVLLEAYLRGCGPLRAELKKQDDVLRKLVLAAMAVKAEKDHAQRRTVAQEELRKQALPSEFALPFDKTIECRGLLLDKCKVMDSKKLPLWVVFQNADRTAPPVPLIFKCGDDLRQDMLTLQMLGLMERAWQDAGLDLLLRPYACISTGLDVGLIEVVPNSETLASITKSYGGAKAVFDEKPLQQWLAVHNNTPESYAKAVETFIYSCAGYCTF